MKIPVIDIFAGPGGLGEGFSSIYDDDGDGVFDIKLSIEKDPKAHETLRLRSFFRKFKKNEVPPAYYKILRQKSWPERKKLIEKLEADFKEQWRAADDEAWCFELPYPEEFDNEGKKKGGYTPEGIVERHRLIDTRILNALQGENDFLLIGGPPCQAYSLVGRSRNQGISRGDHRVHLYKEYLRIIAKHHPAVFVMENVKGLLSSELEGVKIFDLIKNDLQNPSHVFPDLESPTYKIYSLTTPPDDEDNRHPLYKKNRDFLIKAEDFGVPQKRHRVILLGIRDDMDVLPKILEKGDKVTLQEVISDLPPLRSGINRSFDRSEEIEEEVVVDGTLTTKVKKKRYYTPEKDSDNRWKELISKFRGDIISWNGFSSQYVSTPVVAPQNGIGSEFIEWQTPSEDNPLKDWYEDEQFNGVVNHQSRSHLVEDLKRYLFSEIYTDTYGRFPRLDDFTTHAKNLLPDHENAESGKFADRFRVQVSDEPATTVTSHISKDGHYFIHYDTNQCRTLTVREAARIQTFPDNYLFCGARTAQFHQVGNAVPPYLAKQIAEVVKLLFE